MKVFFCRHNFALHKTGEYNLRRAGARRLVSFVDPSRDAVIDYWRAPRRRPPTPRRRPRYVCPSAGEGLV